MVVVVLVLEVVLVVVLTEVVVLVVLVLSVVVVVVTSCVVPLFSFGCCHVDQYAGVVVVSQGQTVLVRVTLTVVV